MKLHAPVLVLMIVGASAALAQPAAIPAGETRAAWSALEQDAASGRLLSRERRFADCPPGEPDARRLLLAADGAPRAYFDRYGSGDALIRRSHAYDAAGRLRAARIDARAASGALRVYELVFDEQGRVQLQAQRLYPGPGWSFPDFWDAADLVRDPRAAFAAASACARETESPR